MPREFVVPYHRDGEPLECAQCGVHQTVGLVMSEEFAGRTRSKGLVCLDCISIMWNTPADEGLVHEPSAYERENGVPILGTNKRDDNRPHS